MKWLGLALFSPAATGAAQDTRPAPSLRRDLQPVYMEFVDINQHRDEGSIFDLRLFLKSNSVLAALEAGQRVGAEIATWGCCTRLPMRDFPQKIQPAQAGSTSIGPGELGFVDVLMLFADDECPFSCKRVTVRIHDVDFVQSFEARNDDDAKVFMYDMNASTAARAICFGSRPFPGW